MVEDKESEHIDFVNIEKKWQRKWADAKLGEAEPDDRKKFFMIFAYPGISGFLHVGHMRGFSYTDAVCRFKRMNGFNVLFPVGTHASGNPAVAFASKIKRRDQGMLDYLELNGYPMDKIADLETASGTVDFFNKNYLEYWENFGFLFDKRRFTCTINPDYNAFIQWQFNKLKEKDLLVQKPYYATFCPVCGPVAVDPSETDISKGGDAERIEFCLLKFRISHNKYLVAATLRPETVFGQTNLWINPQVKYYEVRVGSEIWIMSKEASDKLGYQKDDVTILGETKEKLIGNHATAPMIDKPLIILPSRFVSADFGSGIVTSVPSDAPYDYIALKELQEDEPEMKKYGLNIEAVRDIKVIPIIKTQKFGSLAAVKLINDNNITKQDDPRLDVLTSEVYKEGFHTGVLLDNCGKYSGMKVIEAKNKMKLEMIESGNADILYDLSLDVVCRCGQKVIIKRIDDQWFIKYSDNELTEQSKRCADDMLIMPEDYKRNIKSVLEWFQDRACARQGSWLGTRMPVDKKWIIEPISDSTLYPSYYIVSKYVNDNTLKLDDLDDTFFDFVFLGKGIPKNPAWTRIRNDFDYWYPLDMNLGGKEHQTVHFPVFIMNHVAILPQDKWPRGIFVNYWITGKGSKISKSKGGAVPIPELTKTFSIDAMRLYYARVGSPHMDVLWDDELALNYKFALEKIFNLFIELSDCDGKAMPMDRWIESVFNKNIKDISVLMDNYGLRDAANKIYVDIYNAFKKYSQAGGSNKIVIKDLLSKWALLMTPLTPHIAEELWHRIGNDGFSSSASWPVFDESKIDEKAEQDESNVDKVVSDIQNVSAIIKQKSGKDVSKAYLFVIPVEISKYDADIISKRTGKQVKVFAVNDTSKYDPEAKASKAKIGKPAIFME